MSQSMKVIRKELLYEGRVFKLMRYFVSTPDGEQTRDVIEHRGAVAIIAEVKPNTILLEVRYRPALDTYLYELPAGVLKPGESPEACAKRELLEETGYEAEEFEYLGFFYPTPGYTNEAIHIVATSKVKFVGKPHAEMSPEEKYMSVVEMSLDEAFSKILSGEIRDGKTMIGILMYMIKRGLLKR